MLVAPPVVVARQRIAPRYCALDLRAPRGIAAGLFATDLLTARVFAPDFVATGLLTPDFVAPRLFTPDLVTPGVFARARHGTLDAIAAAIAFARRLLRPAAGITLRPAAVLFGQRRR